MEIKEILQGLRRNFGALWSSKPLPERNSLSTTRQLRTRDYEDIKKVNGAMLPLLALGLVAAFSVGWHSGSVGAVILWGVACLSVGATIGFLFGIPRSGGQTSDSRQQKDPEKIDATNTSTLSKQESETISRPNTNLEEVSDWLTKILVGLTLVHLKSIEGHVMSISQNAAASFNPTPTNADVSAATALVVGFAVIGFLCGYLYTRLFLQGAFIRSDRDMGASRAAIAKELASTSLGAAPISGEPSIPSQSDRKAAERVLEVVLPTVRTKFYLPFENWLQSMRECVKRCRSEMSVHVRWPRLLAA